MTQYADRDIKRFPGLYALHVDAMTREHLHDKADVAAELAYRDDQLYRLQEKAERFDQLRNLLNDFLYGKPLDDVPNRDDNGFFAFHGGDYTHLLSLAHRIEEYL